MVSAKPERRSVHRLLAVSALVALTATFDGCRTTASRGPAVLAPARSPELAVADAAQIADPAQAAEVAWLEGNDRRMARRRLVEALAGPKANDPALLLRLSLLDASELHDKPWADDLLRIVSSAPQSAEAEIALLLLNERLSDLVSRRADVRKALESSGLIGDRPVSASRATLATSILTELSSIDRDEAATRRAAERGGWLIAWRGIGPLGPRSELALATPTPHELTGIDPAKAGTLRGMTPPVRTLSPAHLQVSPIAGDQSGLYVIESYFELDRTAGGLPLELEIHLREPGRVRVDGTVVHEVRSESDQMSALKRVRLLLDPGWHRLTIAVLASPATRPSVSLLASNGKTAIAKQQPTPPAGGLTASGPKIGEVSLALDDPSSSEALLERLIESPAHALFGRLLASKVALSRWVEDLDQGRRLIGPAVQTASRSAPLIAQEAWLMGLEGFPASLSQSRWRNALAADETYPVALIALARSIENDSPDAALALLDRAEKAAPDAAQPHEIRFRIFQRRGWNAEAAKSLALALQRRASEYLLADGATFYRSLFRNNEAIELERRAGAYSASRRADSALLEGNVDRAIEQYREAAKDSWNSAGYLYRIAELELGRGRTDAAVAAAQAVLEQDPLHAGALRTLAVAAKARGDKREAARLVDRARAIGATDMRLEVFAAELEGSVPGAPTPGSWLAKELAIDPRKLVEASAEAAVRWSRHKSVHLLDRTIDRVTKNGQALSVRHAITRLQTKEATDQAGEIQVPGDALLLALRTIKADGRIIDVDRHAGKDDLSFSALAPGDAVEKEWVSLEDSATPWGGYLRRFYFQGSTPLLQSEYVIAVPHGTKVWWRSYHGAPEPLMKTDQGQDVYIWRKRDVPAVDPEPSSVPHEEYLPFVVVAMGIDAQLALQANAQTVESLARSTWDVRQKAEAITSGLMGDEQRVRAIYDWIEKQIGHGAGRDPSIVLATRRGERTGLFVAMLRAVGVEAAIALARPAAAPRVEPSYPNPRRYGAALVRIKIGPEDRRRTLWARMDSSDPWLGGATPDMRGGDYIVPGSEPLKSIAFSESEVERWVLTSNIELMVDAQGTAKGAISIALPGSYGSSLRDFLKSARKDDVARALQGWAALVLPGARLEDFAAENQDRSLEPLKLTVTVVVPQFMVLEGNHLISEQFFNGPIAMRALGFPTLADYLRVPARVTPLYLRELDERMTISIGLPEAAQAPVEAPRSFKEKHDYGHFIQDFTWDPASRSAKLVSQQSIPALRLKAADFPKFRDGVQAILQSTRNRLIVPLRGAPIRQAKGAK